MESKGTQKASSLSTSAVAPDKESEDRDASTMATGAGALAAGAAGATPEITNLRNFRHAPEIENFYRFVDEFNLRREARLIFERVYGVISNVKKKKKNRASKAE